MAKTLFGEYGYTGAPQNINLSAGLYLFELYGAQGKRGWFTSPRGLGGLGGGTIGIFRFSEQTIVNIYVGNGADVAGRVGGYNGGGNGHQSSSYYGGGGGGATDIRIGGNTLSDRVLVAAGGGGASYSGDNGGAAGGLEGLRGGNSGGTGGTQTVGGSVGGALGQGGNATRVSGGGGGGYYGGGAGNNYNAGGGGSSYHGGANGYIPLFSCLLGSQQSGAGFAKIYILDNETDGFPLLIPFSNMDVPLKLQAGIYLCDLYGAQGGFSSSYTDLVAGKGGKVSGNIALINDDTVHVYIGGRNGFNGGGSGSSSSGSGGGGTDIRIGGIALTDRVLVAAGGGGQGLNGGYIEEHGGDGGGLIGESVIDQYNPTYAPTGGTQTEGGYSNGSFGQGGTGLSRGGGGGGGYYGGGGGSGLSGNYYVAGAGGSSYYGGTNGYIPTNPSTETGVNTGNGYAVITLIPQSDSAAVNIQGQNNLIGLNLFTPTDTLENCLRIGTTNGIKAFKLVDVDNVNASPLRVNTCNGIKAISLE